MKFASIIFTALLFTIVSSRVFAYEEAVIEELVAENEKLETLAEFRDSPEMLETKLRQLDLINAFRRESGAPEVAYDLLAGRVGNMHAFYAARDGYFGHWDLFGRKPYVRYGMAGGTDHVSENTWRGQGEVVGDGVTPDYSECSMTDMDKMATAMRRGLDSFMAEGPGGGHYDNVMDPFHTHAGLGFHCKTLMDGNRLTYSILYNEEFIDRYVEFEEAPREGRAGEPVRVSGRVTPPDTGAYAALIYYEPFPEPMTPAQINATRAYTDFTKDMAAELWPWDIEFEPDSRRFSFGFTPGQPGLYYVKMYVKEGIDDIPYKSGGSVTTQGLPAVSGLVVSVEE